MIYYSTSLMMTELLEEEEPDDIHTTIQHKKSGVYLPAELPVGGSGCNPIVGHAVVDEEIIVCPSCRHSRPLVAAAA